MAIRKRSLGDLLEESGAVGPEGLTSAMDYAERHDIKMGEALVKLGLAEEGQVVDALSEQSGLPSMGSIPIESVDLELYRDLPIGFAKAHHIVPLWPDKRGRIAVAVADPYCIEAVDDLRVLLDNPVSVYLAGQSQLMEAINRIYDRLVRSAGQVIEEMEDRSADESHQGIEEIVDIVDSDDEAPIIRFVNSLVAEALKERASDIHFEPFEDEFRIRIKADGVLYEMVPPPRHLAFAITTRIKVMANLDIAERRMPQDGRIELSVGGHPVDLRVSVMPTMFGESVVMRVLDRSVVSLDLTNVGMNDETIASFRQIIEKPNGIVLVTGPTGSGKTTTLYSALTELNKVEDKLITTEDPVEYDIDGIIQIPIDAEIGVTFAACLRAILRQDPDRILVGEIRDLETAEIAVQASLTGHMVFSTLHTNDAPSSITRLKDMGVPTFLITATVEAILAQRLVRRICTQCREEVEPSEDVIAQLKLAGHSHEGKKFYHGQGCDHCNNTGYKGRVGLFELMIMNDELRDLIMQQSSDDILRECAKGNGMVTLRDAGMGFVFDGTTTAEEVIRETILDA